MSLTWSEYRAQILRSVLSDIDEGIWTAEQVHDYIGWAMDTFCNHTALLKEITINDGDLRADGITAYDFSEDADIELPDDLFENLAHAGQVLVTTANGITTFYDPIVYTPGLTPLEPSEPSFWIWPDETLNLSHTPGVGSKLVIRYFAYYPKPAMDDDNAVIRIPRWAQKPLGTLIGAYALENLAVQSANIDRWKDDNDSGNPEHNSLRKQQEAMLKQYEYEISKHIPQDRTNFFRNYESRFS
jgi:hypothetical protein